MAGKTDHPEMVEVMQETRLKDKGVAVKELLAEMKKANELCLGTSDSKLRRACLNRTKALALEVVDVITPGS